MFWIIIKRILKWWEVIALLVIILETLSWILIGIHYKLLLQELQYFYQQSRQIIQKLKQSPEIANLQLGIDAIHVGITYNNIIKDKEYWRLLVAQLTHDGIIHLLFNMYSVFQLGAVEMIPEMRGDYFLKTTIILLLLSGVIYLGLLHVLIKWINLQKGPDKMMVGYSCVLFGWYTIIVIKLPHKFSSQSLLKIVNIPVIFLPFLQLIDSSLRIPGVSFFGHLSGIISGYIVGTGIFDWMSIYVFAVFLVFFGTGFWFSQEKLPDINSKVGQEARQCGIKNSKKEHQD